MDKNQKKILIELMSYESVNGQDLANLIHMSSRSVRTIIKNISNSIIGARIESGKYGYKLIIEDDESFLAYLQNDETEDDEYRQNYIINRFIESDDYIKIDDLCDELYLSRTQLKQIMKNVRLFFDDYHISIGTKTHYGMRLEGNEMDIRKSIVQSHQFQKDINDFEAIKKIVISCIANSDYVVNDDILDNIILLMYVIYIRVKKGKIIDISQEQQEKIKNEREYSLACSMMTLINQFMNLPYYQEEVAFLTMYLCGRNCQQYSHKYIDEYILDIVRNILKTLEKEDHFPFSQDLNLQLALCLHMIPLKKRIQYSTYIKNPLLSDIKRILLYAYELAIKAAEIINQEFSCQLPEDEIAYFALHFNLSLQQNQQAHKKNILLVCSSGVGSARLLEYYFQNNFKKYISKLTVCSKYELLQLSVKDYDCIFTTVPLELDTSVPIFMIHHFMDYNDTKRITKNLEELNHSNILKYFPKELFLKFYSFETKEQAIHEIILECRKYYTLPENFEELILQREDLSTTEVNDLIAFPHTPKPVSSQTFVCVVLLKKPLLWKTKKIRIILLTSIENNAVKELDNFYEVISTFMSDSSLQWQLLQNPTYEEFKSIIERIELL